MKHHLRVLSLVVLISLIVSFITGVAFWHWSLIAVKQVQVEVAVTNESLLGFNTGTDKLYFGTLSPTGRSSRKTTVVSSSESVVVIKVEGDVASWVTVSKNNVVLTPNVSQDIMFDLTVPVGTPARNYTGTAIIEYHRRMFWQ